MAADEIDPYTDPTPPGPIGENLLVWDPSGDGSFTVERKEPDERPSTWKGSQKIKACGDECIAAIGRRQRSGIIDYRILGVTVSYRGKGNGEDRMYLCHTHIVNDCPHTRRIHRYREEHPDEVVPQM